jgi:hypothetical protein
VVTLYAAYATNLDPARMSERCPHSPLVGVGWLVDWRLTFGGEDHGWDGAMPTVVEEPGHQVFVALYHVTDHDCGTLDELEGADLHLYTKLKVRVSTLDGDRLAWIYVLDAYEGGLPSATTIGALADAAEAAGAPDDYVSDLRLRPCRSSGL